MSTKTIVEANYKFVSARKGTKDGRSYSIIELSNGLSSKIFGAPENFDGAEIPEGTDLKVSLEINPFDAFKPFKVLNVSLLKK